LKNNKTSIFHLILYCFSCRLFLTFSHGYFLGNFLLLPGKLIDRTCWIGTRRQQEQNGDIIFGLGPNICHWIGNGVNIFLTQNTGNKFGCSHKCSILSDRSDEIHFHECSHFFLFLTHSFCQIGDRIVFWITLLEVLNPTCLVFGDQFGQLFEVRNRRLTK
jgi:hypothetical protein